MLSGLKLCEFNRACMRLHTFGERIDGTSAFIIPPAMKTIIYITTIMVFLAANVLAKRVAPEEVPPVATDKAVFSVPHFPEGDRVQNGGVVEARDPKTKKLLWQVQVYKTEYDKALEKDVQDVFIKSLTLDKAHMVLIMSDEKARVFVLNLATKRVTRIE